MQKVADIQNQDDATLARTMQNLDKTIKDLMQITNQFFEEGKREAGVTASALCDEAKSMWNVIAGEQSKREREQGRQNN